MFNSRSRKYRGPSWGRCGRHLHPFPHHTPPRAELFGRPFSSSSGRGGQTQVLDLFWCGMNGNSQEWWECHFTPETRGLYFYHFEVRTQRGSQRISKGFAGDGIFGGQQPVAADCLLTKPFTPPDWLEGGVMYQIFPDRFRKSGAPKGEIPAGRSFHQNWEDQPDWGAKRPGKNYQH